MSDRDFIRYLIIWRTCYILKRSCNDKFIKKVVIKKYSDYLSTINYSYTSLVRECVNRILIIIDGMEESRISVETINSVLHGITYNVYLDGNSIRGDEVISLFYKSYKTTGNLNLWPILD